MTEDNLPQSATQSRFGWPKPTRIEEFKKMLAETPAGPTTRIVLMGKTADIPIIRVPIGLPKYRLENGRTVSLQAEHLAENPAVRADIFSGDPELWDAQEIQHGLLLKLGKLSDLHDYFADTTHRQIDPILLDEHGFVVNGNRRLSCWRELLFNESNKYGHFSHIDVAVLPHCDDKEIDRLEATLQVEPDIKADYSWDALANMMLAKQKRDNISNKVLGERYGMKEAQVEQLFDMRAYADDYLRSRGHKDRWSLVTDDEFAFRKLVTTRQKVSGVGAKELFKQAAYALIEKPSEAGGRLYEVIPAIAEYLPAVREKLQAEFPTIPSKPSGELGELLGGGSTTVANADLPLAKEIQKAENTAKARKTIAEVIEAQKQLKLDSKQAEYLLKSCANAQAALAGAIKDGLRPEAKIAGVEKQLEQISKQVERIREFLKEHVAH